MKSTVFLGLLFGLLGSIITLILLPVIISSADVVQWSSVDGAVDYLTAKGYIVEGTTGIPANMVPFADVGGDQMTYNVGFYFTPGTTTLTVPHIAAPTGRGATYVIAASDSTITEKAQADIVCDGTADEVQINAAYASGYDDVFLMNGTFIIAAPVTLITDNDRLIGSGWTTNLQPSGNLTSLIQVGGTAGDTLCEGIELKDFSIDGKTGTYSLTQAILISGVTRPLIEHLFIYNVSGNGITIASTGTYSVFVPIIQNCWLNNMDNKGIEFTSSGGTNEGAKIIGNNIEGTDSQGIHLRGGYHSLIGNKLNNCCLTGQDASIVSDATKIEIIGGEILASNRVAIKVSSSTSVIGVHFTDASIVANNTYDWIQVFNATDEGVTIDGCTFRTENVNKARYFIWVRGNPANVIFSNNTIKSASYVTGFTAPLGTADPISGLTASGLPKLLRNNIGYIDSGEVRTASGSLTGGAANAILFAWHNPEAQDIYIKKVVIVITTADADAANIDVGIADDATYTNGGTEFFNDLTGETILVYDSWVVGDLGTQTKWVFCQDSASATDGWVVAKILTNDGTSIVGSWYIEYVGK